MSLKGLISKAIITIANSISQSSVKEIDDGITSSEAIATLCRKATAEGCVLLKNNGVLPLANKKFALFGRCQINTFYVGYGSGGDVKPPYRVSLLEGLKAGGALLDENVVREYEAWTKKHVPDDGIWGFWPMCYKEMPVSEKLLSKAAEVNETAVIVIGRSAGEDRESLLKKGSWYLNNAERRLLQQARLHFKKLCVLINSGTIMDVSGIMEYNPDALMFIWQGGQEMGNGVADVLLGKVSPSGKLTDTLAKIQDYPSFDSFGGKKFNEYTEDIYVGYRYFNTFAEDKIIYPFGYGLSYTSFTTTNIQVEHKDSSFKIRFDVTNVGSCSGKQVIQLYGSAPQGRLGKPDKELIGFVKTNELKPKEKQEFLIEGDFKSLASYDDTGASGFENCFVLEQGEYRLFIGEDINSAVQALMVNLPTTLVKQCEEACAPTAPFSRIVNSDGLKYALTPAAKVDLREKILSRLPKEFVTADEKTHAFADVLQGIITPEQFTAQLNDKELEAITRGSLYGMYSPLGPAGNAGTFGANCKSLTDRGIPAISTNDGPSGARLQAHSTLVPNGVALASSFNTQLTESLTYELGKEIQERNSHVLLAPGLNIHRNPLCGRNFEYFSEDPYLSGKLAAAYIRGLQRANTSATAKHFACNNQEKHRTRNNSIVSQRALREIYLKSFEICVKEAAPDCLMTSYNKINGVFSYYNYDLVTAILRKDWGFNGCVMTDWWMRNGKSPLFENLENQAYRIRAQVDVFMPGSPKVGKYHGKSDGSILKSLSAKNGLTKAELQACAANVIRLCMKISQRN